MVAYSYAQLEGLWIKAGGDPAVASIAAAIVFPESGGNPQALNPTDNGGTQSSFGLWQISNGTHTPPDPNWADPLTNARLAVNKYKGAGNSFSPWGTYDSGAYKRYVQTGVTPDMTAGGADTATLASANQNLPGSGPTTADPSTWLNPAFQLVYNLGNYAFFGICLVGGAGLILLGLILMVKSDSIGSTVGGVVGGVVGVVPRETSATYQRRLDRSAAIRNERRRVEYRNSGRKAPTVAPRPSPTRRVPVKGGARLRLNTPKGK